MLDDYNFLKEGFWGNFFEIKANFYIVLRRNQAIVHYAAIQLYMMWIIGAEEKTQIEKHDVFRDTHLS